MLMSTLKKKKSEKSEKKAPLLKEENVIFESFKQE